MANLDRVNAALDAIGTALDEIISKVENWDPGINDTALADVADKAEAIKAQVDELDALVSRPNEAPTEPTAETLPAEDDSET